MSFPFKPQLTVLKFDDIIDAIRQRMGEMTDPRIGKNIRYNMEQLGLGAFSVFFMQSPSFLSHQTLMQQNFGNNNADTLFGIGKDIPTDNHIRKQLDSVPPSHLFPLFRQIFDWLSQQQRLESLRTQEGQLLVAMDGTQYHSSKKVHCDQCSTKNHRDGTTTYSHSVVTPVIVSPGVPYVVPLEPEFITPQDGHNKQDCENAAIKRWVHQHGSHYAPHGITILGDDLYSRTPVCNALLEEGFNFLLVCKTSSHKTLYEWVEEIDALGKASHHTVTRKRGKKIEVDHYRWIHQLPLTDDDNALKVNWCELTTTDGDGKVLRKHSYITNHKITQENIVEMVESGRARWKIENENNNTLKTKGYHLEHNFGHGKKHLSSLLATMNLLAFLVHTLLEQMDSRYQLIRTKLPTRKIFYQHIATLTQYEIFSSFGAMLEFMLYRLEHGPQPPDFRTPSYQDST